MSTFKAIKTGSTPDSIAEPVLCSFPCNMPPNLAKMHFTVLQDKKRRVVKAEHKGIKYEAKNFGKDMSRKD